MIKKTTTKQYNKGEIKKDVKSETTRKPHTGAECTRYNIM